MEKKSIAISIRFKGSISQIDTILFLKEILSQWFNKSIVELNYTITDKSDVNWKQKSKRLKFTDKAIEKYKEVLKDAGDKTLIDFELLRNLDDYEYKSRDVDFSIIYKQTTLISALNFVFDLSLYKEVAWKIFVRAITDFLVKMGCEVVYGFILSLEKIKNPSLYIEGIGNYELTPRENDKVNTWANEMASCETKVWDIFWGNILSHNHIKVDNSIEKIKRIVGDENSLFLNKDLFWFNLKLCLTKFDVLKYDKEQQKLYEFFRKNNLILI